MQSDFPELDKQFSLITHVSCGTRVIDTLKASVIFIDKKTRTHFIVLAGLELLIELSRFQYMKRTTILKMRVLLFAFG